MTAPWLARSAVIDFQDRRNMATKPFYFYSEEIVGVLRKLMEDKKYSQADLANRIGISPSFLSDILARRRDPGKKLLMYLGLERRIVYVNVSMGQGGIAEHMPEVSDGRE
jgi:hypothetical protein